MGYFELEKVINTKDSCFNLTEGECVIAWTSDVALVYRLGKPSASAVMLYLTGITITPEWSWKVSEVSVDALIRLKYWPIRYARSKNEAVLLYDVFLKELNAKEVKKDGKVCLAINEQLYEVDQSVVKKEMEFIELLKRQSKVFERPINYLFRKTEEMNERLKSKAKKAVVVPFKL